MLTHDRFCDTHAKYLCIAEATNLLRVQLTLKICTRDGQYEVIGETGDATFEPSHWYRMSFTAIGNDLEVRVSICILPKLNT